MHFLLVTYENCKIFHWTTFIFSFVTLCFDLIYLLRCISCLGLESCNFLIVQNFSSSNYGNQHTRVSSIHFYSHTVILGAKPRKCYWLESGTQMQTPPPPQYNQFSCRLTNLNRTARQRIFALGPSEQSLKMPANLMS